MTDAYNMKTLNKKTQNKVEYFTDAMHKEIFPFQPSVSSKSWGAKKPITNPLVIKPTKNR